jgi:hypothetical protein
LLAAAAAEAHLPVMVELAAAGLVDSYTIQHFLSRSRLMGLRLEAAALLARPAQINQVLLVLTQFSGLLVPKVVEPVFIPESMVVRVVLAAAAAITGILWFDMAEVAYWVREMRAEILHFYLGLAELVVEEPAELVETIR